LVLIHGSGSNSATWFADVAAYSQKYSVYCVDIPGEPGKSAPERFDWHGPAFSEWLAEVLQGLGIKQTVLGGISLGGWASLKYAVDKPGKVEKLVLICPGGVTPSRPSFILRMIFFSMLGEWGLERMKRLIFKDLPLTEEADLYFRLTAKHFNYRRGEPPIFTDEQLRRITMPVLFLGGQEDIIFNTGKAAQRLKALLPDLTVKLYGGKGHALVNMAGIVMPLLD
jgi:pimeloyl-ACP methyl ester carboxylesterase